MIGRTYALLGLFSFLTAGPDECRAWTIPDGATALDAAGTIHSDLARGFIRAEVVDWKDLGLRIHGRGPPSGLLRSEGKAYRVRDGDVIEVLFNVGVDDRGQDRSSSTTMLRNSLVVSTRKVSSSVAPTDIEAASSRHRCR